MRPDAYRFLRSDWRCFTGGRQDPLHQLFECAERKYRPDQPRVPRGSLGGGQWTRDDGTSDRPIQGLFLMRPIGPHLEADMRRIGRARPLRVSLSMGGLSKPRLGSKPDLRSLRLRPETQFGVFKNSIQNGGRRLVLMKASKVLSKPIEVILAKPRDEFPNCRVPALVLAHSQAGQYRRVVPSEFRCDGAGDHQSHRFRNWVSYLRHNESRNAIGQLCS